MTPTPAGVRDVLTEHEAAARAARGSHASYDLRLDLTRGFVLEEAAPVGTEAGPDRQPL